MSQSPSEASLPVALCRRFLLLVFLFTFLPSPSFAADSTAPLEKITLQLKWRHQFQFAGYYAAEAKGFYKEEGLDVQLLEGGSAAPPIPRVLEGTADFGIGDSDILIARMQGKPLVAMAAIFQHSPYILLSRKDRNIHTPADLVGKSVMASEDQGEAQLKAMLIQEGINIDLVHLNQHSWSLQDLIDGKVDAISAYASVEPEYLRKKGIEPAVLNSMNYGVDFYGDTLFTTESRIADHPERTAAFLRASLKGWDYALSHTDEIADLILKMPNVAARGVTKEMLLKEAKDMQPFILAQIVEIGHMNPGRWQHIADSLVKTGIAPPLQSLQGFLYEPKKPAARTISKWLAALAALILLSSAFIVLWNIRIRRQIEARTGELDTEIKFRKMAESRLESSQALVRSTFNAAGAGITISDASGKFLLVNPAYCMMVGYTESELLQRDIQSIVLQEDMEVNRGRVDQLFAGEVDVLALVKRYIKKNGDIAWISENISLLRDHEGQPTNIITVTEDITERKFLESLKSEQDHILEQIAAGAPLQEILNISINAVEKQYPTLICSIHLLAADEIHLQHGAAQGLPAEYIEALKGVAIGPKVGSCGTAAFERRTVIVEDITIDPLWADYRHLALKHGLRSCWSMPIYSSKNEVLGTFAVYSRSASSPSQKQVQLHELLSHIVGIAIEKHKAEETLRIADSHIRDQASLLDKAQDAIVVRSLDSRILYWNKGAERLYGWKDDEVLGLSIEELELYEHAERFREATRKLLKDGEWSGEFSKRHKDGHYLIVESHWTLVQDDESKPKSVFCIDTDITHRKEAEKQIQHLAFYDHLTGLPNRQLLVDRMQMALNSRPRKQNLGALLFIDLDNFKTLNDALGHDVGDMLLKQVAGRLSEWVRDGDTVARFGGDEFVVMLDNLSNNSQEAASQAQIVGNNILEAFRRPFQLDKHEQYTTPSIGIALFNSESTSVEAILKRADIAMYQAKSSGRNTMRFFDPVMQSIIDERVELEINLRLALRQKQLLLLYQSQVDHHGTILGFEALIRWQDPVKGMISPASFIPLAEETGLILPIGLWVLEAACLQLVAWAGSDLTSPLSISVNVSAKQFKQPDFEAQVISIIKSTDANPNKLKLELTETMLVDNLEDIIDKMTALKKIGVRFSLDDFGTGYSSLSYLKRLPLSQLKIDQSFVRNICSDANDAAIACTIITLGKTLGLSVIAEGVETPAQKNFLNINGCSNYQGYLFSKPLPIGEVNLMLAREPQNI